MAIRRRTFVALIGAVLAAGGLGTLLMGPGMSAAEPVAAAEDAPLVKVYKSPNCECCGRWADHLRESGFAVEVTKLDDVYPMKDELGVPRHLRSCHTGVVDGYVIEGHVPADVVNRLLEARPEVTGIAVPGMPAGSPGMEVGAIRESYDVIAFGGGTEYVYESR